MKRLFFLFAFLLGGLLMAQTATFGDFKKKADDCFLKKDYACARLNYDRALRIRSEDAYCKGQLKKIEIVEARQKKERQKAQSKKENEAYEAEQKARQVELLRLEQERIRQEQEALAVRQRQKEKELEEVNKIILKTNYPKITDEDQDGVPWPFDVCPSQKGEVRFWGCPSASASNSLWRQYTDGHIPPDAVALGKSPEGKNRYLARAGMNLLGYIDEGQTAATIGAGNITVSVYDMLEKGQYSWKKPSTALFISGRAVPRSEGSSTNFIARHMTKKKCAVGVANPEKTEALFFDQSSDFQESNYEILVNELLPVGILQIQKDKSVEGYSLVYSVNGIKTPYNILEVKPGNIELTVELKEKKKPTPTLASDKLVLTILPKITYKYTLEKLSNGTIALVEDTKTATFGSK